VDTSEFEDVKARLYEIENRRNVDGEDNSVPSLRRRSSGTDTRDGGDDRPTLKRRPGSDEQ
jgi:hypothetical protein